MSTNASWYLNTDPNRGGWIYAVYDAREPERVRYVGKTQVSIKERTTGHWYDARRQTRRSNSRMVNWLLKRLDQPEIVGFREVGFYPSLSELNHAEISLIAELRAIGQADLNIADGGEGRAGVPWSEETRKKVVGLYAGEKHPNASITWQSVNRVRELAQSRWVPREEAASLLGCGPSNAAKVLNGTVWHDSAYDPDGRVKKPRDKSRSEKVWTRILNWETVNEIRELRKSKWVPLIELSKMYGVGKSNMGYILSNVNWFDPEYNPENLAKRNAK